MSHASSSPRSDLADQPLLPEAFVAYARRRAFEAAGVAFAALGLALLVALAGYDPADPSLNHATGRAAANPLGRLGAGYADFALQTLGLAAALVPLAVVVWGGRLMVKQPVRRIGWRLAAAALASVFATLALAAAPPPAPWPILTGLGGTVGRIGMDQIRLDLDIIGAGVPDAAVAALAGFLALSATVFATGLTLREGRHAGAWALIAGQRVRAGLRAGLDPRRWRGLRERIEPWFDRSETVGELRLGVAVGGRDGDDENVPRAPSPRALAADPGDAAQAIIERRARITADKAVVEDKTKPKTGKKAQAQRQGRLDLGPTGAYEAPPLDLLAEARATAVDAGLSKESLENNAELLASVLSDFGVKGEIVKVRPGPVVTLYELEPAPGTKTSRVIGLADDIARSMSAVSVRVAVVPGRNVIGIELPNVSREMVQLREMLGSRDYEKAGAKLPLALGKDIGGAPVVADLAKMPHLLIAGTTGSGKSVAMNTMILSLLYRLSPDQCKFIMVDPKMLELSVYDDIPHLLSPVVTDPSKAVVALKWTVREMEDRYRAMATVGVRNIAGYNAKIADAAKKGEVLTRRVQTGFDDDGRPVYEDQPLGTEPLPYIVVVVDEMADLMLVAGKDVEAAIQRLAQMARAAGIHLIMATQRPSVDVITGTIKANFPTRISFQVTSKIDSRTILGEQGAEQLLGQGDMLYMAGGGRITRVHGPFVSDDEVEGVVSHLKAMGEPDYIETITEDDDVAADIPGMPGAAGGGDAGDQLYDEAVAIVAREGKASTSFIQRHLQIGYNRAARIIERMEAEGVVSKADRVGRREVLVGSH